MSRLSRNTLLVLISLAIIWGGYTLIAKDQHLWPYASAVQYRNAQYGFVVSLPESWQGYTVVPDIRELRDVTTGDVVATAPIINIRHPLWTVQNPRQDIPIDIYTLAQWDKIMNEQYSVSAAPIPPSELAHNSRYIFALPARYNYAFLPGFEEVDQLIRSGIVTAF